MNIGTIVEGKYEIIDSIGNGGMGTVVKVSNISTGEHLALKYCQDSDEGAIRRFAREVRIMSETIHPNIVTVLDSNVDHTPPYFIMPLASSTLSALIPKLKGNIKDIAVIFDEVCKGISAMHLSSNFHRDIKPSNVLLMETGQIVVSDFGLSKKLVKDSSTHSSSNNFLGTFGYHAPEQFDAKDSDARTDVYQLGKTLYEIYTGEYPFLINTTKVTPGLAYIIQKATKIDPNERYQSVSDLQQALNTYILSLDPNRNPKDAFESMLNEVKSLLASGQYDEQRSLALLESLNLVKDDPQTFLDYFDRIPNNLLRVLSSQLDHIFEDTLNVYTSNLEKLFDVWGYNFSYAEIVAEKMTIVFESAKKTEFKVSAIYNTLIAAVRCNRFRAMDIFDSLLLNVKTDTDAMAISEILRKGIDFYRQVYDRIPKNKLHYIIQAVWMETGQLTQNEKLEEEKKRKEWLKRMEKLDF